MESHVVQWQGKLDELHVFQEVVQITQKVTIQRRWCTRDLCCKHTTGIGEKGNYWSYWLEANFELSVSYFIALVACV